MSNIELADTKDIINPQTDYVLRFRVFDKFTKEAVAVTTAPIKLHVVGDSNLIYSGSLRTTITDTNLVEIHLTPTDNIITTTYGVEKRRILCDTRYVGGVNKYAFLYSIEYDAVQ